MSWDEVVEVSPAGSFSNRSWLKTWKRLGKVVTTITLYNQKTEKKNSKRQQHAKEEFVPSSPLVKTLINQTKQKRILNIVLICLKLQAAVSVACKRNTHYRMTPNKRDD